MSEPELERIIGEVGDPQETVDRVVEHVDSFGDDGREALLRRLQRARPSDSTWRNVLIIASDEIEFLDDSQREQLRTLLMKQCTELWGEYIERGCETAGAALAVPISRDERRTEIERALTREALLAAFRKVTSLTPPDRHAETATWLCGFLREGSQSPLMQQAAAQCLQNLCWTRPLPEEQSREVKYVCDELVNLARRVLAKPLEPGLPSTLALNLVRALGVLGDARFRELALRLLDRAPHVDRLLYSGLQSILDRWAKSSSKGSLTYGRLHEFTVALKSS